MIKVCKNCDKREVGCHSYCKEYIIERKKLNEQNANNRKMRGEYVLYVNRKKQI